MPRRPISVWRERSSRSRKSYNCANPARILLLQNSFTRRLMRSFLAVIALSGLFQSSVSAQNTFLGFSASSSTQQRSLEAKFDSFLKADNLRTWMKRLSARPHHLGSAYGKENADFIAAQFRSWGFDTKLEEFDVLFPTPKTRIVEMTAPERFTLKLNEPAPSSRQFSFSESETARQTLPVWCQIPTI